MGLKRDSSRGSFVRSVTKITEAFYADVIQNLRAWKAAPPKLKRPAEEELVETVADAVGVAPETVHEESLREEGPASAEVEYVETPPASSPESESATGEDMSKS
jgi:hypothetical protein